MAKARLIRPEIWTDAKFVGLAPLARLLFIGMWNFACDNGHLDNNALELKMRVLPADSCDVNDLLDEIIASGMVVTKDDYIKIPRLPDKQTVDLRYLQFCDACDSDVDAHYSRSDKKDGKGHSAGGTRVPREQPASSAGGAVGEVSDVVVVCDVVGGGKRASRAHQLPDDFEPNDTNRRIAKERGLDLAEVVAQFCDHHRAKGSTMKDWHLALNTWLRREKPTQRTGAKVSHLPRHVSQLEEPPSGLSDAELAKWYDDRGM